MGTKNEPFLARYASVTGIFLIPICLAPLFVLPHTSAGKAFAIFGICAALMAFVAAWFRLVGDAVDRRHLDLIGKHVSVAAATLTLWTAGAGYFFFDQLAASAR